jgi:molybdenum cofactor synthesis domain-containing protein
MRPIRDTIPLAEARQIIAAHLAPLDRVERVALEAARNRVLAQAVVSEVDVPPFARAAMDGYAVRAEDTFGASRNEPIVLRCVEQIFTGQVPAQTVQPGQCAEIATGAPMPPGADAVVIVEESDSSGSDVRIFTPVYPKQHVGRQGADIQRGQPVLSPGDLLTPSKIGVLAALGLTHVDVYARPRVAILSTGNEIVAPGEPLGPGQIYDINRFTIAALVESHGGVAIPYRTVADTIDDLSHAVDACLEGQADGGHHAPNDVLVFSGGSSVGERDLILDVLAARGEVLFHGIAVKPGKPMAFGRVGGRLFFGMPGYPTSCLTNTYALLVPALRHIARLPAWEPRTVTLPLGARVVSVTGRHQFYTVRIENGVAMPAFKSSGDITSMSRADGYIEIPAHTDILEKGEMVEIKLF